MPLVTRPQVHRIVYELLPRKRWTPEELLGWLYRTQVRNERAKQSHARRRAWRRLIDQLVAVLLL